MRCLTTFATMLAAVTYAAAHGYVTSVTDDGNTEIGCLPFADPYETPAPIRAVRKIPDDGPVMDVTSTDIACNKGGNVGTNKTFGVNAGSNMTFQWTEWPDSHKGPVTILMASCNGNCLNFTASDGKWFKIDEGGYSNGQWASEKLIADGNKWTSAIPTGVPPGQYLVRYEIVALHDVGEPQFYPGCVQVNVKNGGAGWPSASEFASLPGMYNGYTWPDIYTDNLENFTVAGPNIASLVESASEPVPYPSSLSSSVSNPAPYPSSLSSSVSYNSYGLSSTISPSRPCSTSTPAKPTRTGTCRAKKCSPRKRSFSARHIHRRSSNH